MWLTVYSVLAYIVEEVWKPPQTWGRIYWGVFLETVCWTLTLMGQLPSMVRIQSHR